MAIAFRFNKEKTRIPADKFDLEELRTMPGFDEQMHKARFLDKTVEIRHGVQTVVYRTKPEITLEAARAFDKKVF